MLTTWLTETFDLTVPIVSAPMAGASGGRLAAAVSAAGALGTIGFAGRPAEDLRREVDLAREAQRPFGIGLLAWTMPADADLVGVAIESGASLVAVSYGDLAPHVDRLRAAGVKCATQVGTVEDARAAAAMGVDVLVARGEEAGGHGRGVVATLPLLQAVLDEVDTPVLAAGGIATARGVAAVIAAGAAGAWVGTAFLAAREADNKPEHRRAVIEAGLTDTMYSTVFDMGRGIPWPPEFGGRALRTAYAERWHGREDELARVREPMDESAVWAGQAAGLVTTERAAADIVAELAQAEDLLRSLGERLSPRPG